MKILAMVSQKGGAGKSLVTAHLAAAFEQAGISTVVIDLDPQASITQWGESRSTDSPTVVSGLAERLPVMLKTAHDASIDLAVIDTPPHSDKNALAAIRTADLVLIPTRAAIFDLRSIAETVKVLDMARHRDKAVILLNSVPARGSLANEGEDAAREYGVEIAPVRLTERAAFAHALTSGLGITEYEPKGKAAAEIIALMRFVAQRLGLKLA
jgi:chromosome partitioning protein